MIFQMIKNMETSAISEPAPAIPVVSFSPGIYVVRLGINGSVIGVEKMVVIH